MPGLAAFQVRGDPALQTPPPQRLAPQSKPTGPIYWPLRTTGGWNDASAFRVLSSGSSTTPAFSASGERRPSLRLDAAPTLDVCPPRFLQMLWRALRAYSPGWDQHESRQPPPFRRGRDSCRCSAAATQSVFPFLASQRYSVPDRHGMARPPGSKGMLYNQVPASRSKKPAKGHTPRSDCRADDRRETVSIMKNWPLRHVGPARDVFERGLEVTLTRQGPGDFGGKLARRRSRIRQPSYPMSRSMAWR